MQDTKSYRSAVTKRLSQVWRSHWPAIPQGVFTGSIAALVYLTAKPFFSPAVGWATGKIPQEVVSALQAPEHLRGLILVLSVSLLLAILDSCSHFLVRLFNSWRFGIVVGLFPVATVATFLSWTIAPGIAATIAVAEMLTGLVVIQILFAALFLPKTPTSVSIPDIPIDSFAEIDFDSPIRDWQHDLVGRSEFVRAVISRILVDGAPVIAVTGDYGEGKSSVLNLVDEVLQRETSLVVVRFSSWVPGNDQSYASSLFSTVSERIQDRFFFPSLRKTLMQLARTVASSIPAIPLKEFLEQPSQVSELEKIRQVFTCLPVRVVVLVDEIDRMQTDELETLLRVLRGIPEITNLTYVCAINVNALESLAKKWTTEPRKYLEKFFTAQLSLPKVDAVLLDELFHKTIDRIIGSVAVFDSPSARKAFDEGLTPIWSQTLKWQLTNLRKMGQFLRLFETTLTTVKREVNALDLLVLQALQILVPEAYEFVYARANLFYQTKWRLEKWQEAPHVDDKKAQEQRVQVFKEFFEGLDDQRKSLAQELMKKLFPFVEQSLEAPTFPLAAHDELTAVTERRIYHPDFFPRYFIHRAPLNLIGQTELIEFSKKLHAVATESKNQVILDMLGRIGQNSSRRWDFWDRVAGITASLDDESRIALAMAAARASESFAQGFLGIGEYPAGRRLIFNVAFSLEDKNSIQGLLERVIREASSDYFASDILRFASNKEDRSISELSGFVNLDRLSDAFAARMSALYYPWSSRAPNYKSGDAVHAFVRWSRKNDEARQKVYAYFRSRFAGSPNEEEEFMVWVIPPDSSFEGSLKKFFEFLFPVNEFIELTALHRPNWPQAALNSFSRLESDTPQPGGDSECMHPG